MKILFTKSLYMANIFMSPSHEMNKIMNNFKQSDIKKQDLCLLYRILVDSTLEILLPIYR